MIFAAFEHYASQFGLRTQVTPALQTSDYESGIAEIHGEAWHLRTARNTPLKTGAFVAFWRRAVDAKTAPFSDDDTATGLLVFVHQEERRGVFRFTSSHLVELGVITAGERTGKRGFRVYPPWCRELNSQAAATQRAHASAFKQY